MITKIKKIKNFGIFRSFVWNDLSPFRKKNLIYGWNYSGKTTLSKLFQNIEFQKSEYEVKYFNDAEIIIEYEYNQNKNTVNQQNLQSFPYNVKVFNIEYIKRVFSWDEPKSDIEPISFYLGNPAGSILKKIEDLNNTNKKLTNIKNNRYQKFIDNFNEYSKQNGKFTEKAKKIREEYLPKLFATHEFNKSRFEEITKKVKSNISNYILENNEKDKLRQEALAEKEYENLTNNFQVDEELKKLKEEVRDILEDTAPQSIEFPELEKDTDLFNWVQEGIALHKDETHCKFCTNKLPESRIDSLNAYYSNKLIEIQNSIAEVKKKIEHDRNNIEIDFPNEHKLAKHFRDEYLIAINKYENSKEEYKKQLLILESELKRKEKKVFNSINPTEFDEISLSEPLLDISSIIKKHNEWLNEFDNRKNTAIEKLLNHYVAEYLENENYIEKEKENNNAKSIIDNIQKKIGLNENEIRVLNSKLSDKVKGQNELNNSLKILLHRNDIKIEIRNEKFTLERSGYPATSLSEGEKSAIAFSYFLTELKSLREESKLQNYIIFIDDPVSSLDNNHIFQVRSLIHNFFTTNDFNQLFISTHNFEFLSVMLDTKLFGRINRDTSDDKCPLFFIKRIQDNESEIKKLPKSFSIYKSEYVGLFHIIKKYHESTDKENFPDLLMIPNVVRRFLELYTLMKYPSEGEVDKRVKRVFNPNDRPYHNTKLLHWFSHQNRIEKVQQHDDKLFQIEEAIEDLLDYIKTEDELHWEGLNGS